MFKFPIHVKKIVDVIGDDMIRITYDDSVANDVFHSMLTTYFPSELFSFVDEGVVEFKDRDKFYFEFFFITDKNIALPAILNNLHKTTTMETLENFYTHFKEVLGEIIFIFQLPILKEETAAICPETHFWGYKSMMKTYYLHFGFTPDEAIPYQFLNRVAFDALIGYVYDRDDGFLVCSSCFRAFPKRSVLIDSYNENVFEENYCIECRNRQKEGI